MKSKNLIVFDMDGVIMDVSNSYRDVVRQTTKLFFSPAHGSEKLPDPLFNLSDLAGIKQSGGLNNDWNLTYTVINLLFSLIKKPSHRKSKDTWETYRETLNRCDVTPISGFLNSADKPLQILLEKKGINEDNFVRFLHEGDVGSGNIIKQIFQEIYLGKELFISTYGLTPKMYHGKGYILRETVMMTRLMLEELSRINHLAIATGRPIAEAEYPLEHFKLKGYFDIVYSLDDCLKEEKRILDEEGKEVSLSKPDPYMLDAIAEKYEDEATGFYYVGDMPDDMVAAGRSRFGYKSIGILISAPDKLRLKEKLVRAGADYIVDDFEDLKEIIL